jgi:N-acetylglucosamine-6-sulfatase
MSVWSAPPPNTKRGRARVKPNIVLLLTDDQDERSLAVAGEGIEQTLGASGGNGATFTRAFVTTPVCCTSRVSQLTGAYAHNHKVYTNFPPTGSITKFREEGWEDKNVVSLLKNAGYRTTIIGKYMNGYTGGYVPAPWERFFASTRPYQDSPPLTFYENMGLGSEGPEYSNDPTRYLDTYLLRDVAVREIGRWGADRPLFMVVSFHGPHFPAFFDAADADRFTDLKAPRVPSWGVSDADDPQYVKNQAPLTDAEAREADNLYRKKARSILAIRRAIDDIVAALRDKGQLSNTYLLFTSDNGYRHGEHAMVHGKHTPYEEDINIPLFVRGPDVSKGVRLPNFALNIDLAPTFCEWAGVAPRSYMDGRSLAPLLRGESIPWRTHFLVEHWVESGVPTYKGVRSNEGRIYVEYSSGESAGDKELYDVREDPYQLNNLMDEEVPTYLRERLTALKACSGDECRSAEEVSRP